MADYLRPIMRPLKKGAHLKELTFKSNEGGLVELRQLAGLLLEAQETLGPRASVVGATVDRRTLELKLYVEPQE